MQQVFERRRYYYWLWIACDRSKKRPKLQNGVIFCQTISWQQWQFAIWYMVGWSIWVCVRQHVQIGAEKWIEVASTQCSCHNWLDSIKDETQLPGDKDGSIIAGTSWCWSRWWTFVWKMPFYEDFKGLAAQVLFGPISAHNSSSVILGCTDVEKGKGCAVLWVQEAALEHDKTLGCGVPLSGNIMMMLPWWGGDEDLQHRSAAWGLFEIKEQISCIQKLLDNKSCLLMLPGTLKTERKPWKQIFQLYY